MQSIHICWSMLNVVVLSDAKNHYAVTHLLTILAGVFLYTVYLLGDGTLGMIKVTTNQRCPWVHFCDPRSSHNDTYS